MLHALMNFGIQYMMKKYLDVLENPPGTQHAVLELVGSLFELLQALMDLAGIRHAVMNQVCLLPLIGLIHTSLVLLLFGLMHARIVLLFDVENPKNIAMDLAGSTAQILVVDQTPAEDVAGVIVPEVGAHTES